MKLPFEDSENYRRLLAIIEPKQDKWDLSPNDVKAISWAVDMLRELAEKSKNVKPFAYVSLKPCGCMSLCMTQKYVDRYMNKCDIDKNIENGQITPVDADEFRKLTYFCDICWENEQ